MMEDVETRTKIGDPQIKCPECDHWIVVDAFVINQGKCVFCGSEFEFKMGKVD